MRQPKGWLVRKAEELMVIANRPENSGRRWDWMSIGIALNLTAAQARQVVYYLRLHYTEAYWTIGTADLDYTIAPVRSARQALNGQLNQIGHLIARLKSQARAWQTLAQVDPDPGWARFAELNARHYQRRADDEADFRESLLARIHDLAA